MESAQTSFRYSRFFLIIVSGIAIALGLTVMLAWHTHYLPILQVRAGYKAIVYNTAICFVLSGLGLLAVGVGKPRGTLIGALVAIFGILHIMEDILDVDLGIDNFFFTHYLAVQAKNPGDMAPITSLCFTLLGGAFLLMALAPPRRWRSPALVLLGSGVTIMSVVALFGYLLGIPHAHSWGQYTHIALPTTAGLFILGVAIIAVGWQMGKAAQEGIQYWFSAAMGLSACTISLLLWEAIVVSQRHGQANTVPLVTAGGAVLVVGLFMGALLALAVHFTQKARLYLQVSRESARQLEKEMAVRQYAESALEQREEQYRRIVETAQEGIWVLDGADRTTFVNPKMAAMLGYTVDAMMGRPMAAFLDDSLQAVVAGHLQRCRQGLQEHLELRFSRRDGVHLWALVAITPLLDKGGRYQGALAMVTDITQRREAFHQLRRALRGTVTALASTTESRDPYTAGHQRRVAQLACAIAQQLGFSPERVEGIQVMGFLHDIGKIAVPAEILSKPGKISDYELSIIKTHPRVGHDILQEIEFPWPVAQAVLQHHERLDGSGYPAGLTGAVIIPEARILAVADVVEASASHRPYRPARGLDQALMIVSRHRGSRYDPQVVDVCVRLFTEEGFQFQ